MRDSERVGRACRKACEGAPARHSGETKAADAVDEKETASSEWHQRIVERYRLKVKGPGQHPVVTDAFTVWKAMLLVNWVASEPDAEPDLGEPGTGHAATAASIARLRQLGFVFSQNKATMLMLTAIATWKVTHQTELRAHWLGLVFSQKADTTLMQTAFDSWTNAHRTELLARQALLLRTIGLRLLLQAVCASWTEKHRAKML